MNLHGELYDVLLDYANVHCRIERLTVGTHWTLCSASAMGLAQTLPCRNDEISVTTPPLQGRTLAELSQWIRSCNPRQASIGLAAVNAAINREADIAYMKEGLFKGGDAFQRICGWFLPQLSGCTVVASGEAVDCLRRAGLDVVSIPVSTAITPEIKQIVTQADWLFLPSRTIIEKTLPNLLSLAQDATCVLFGVDVPWVDEWRELGVDYLIGGQIDKPQLLQTQITEGAVQQMLTDTISYRLVSYAGVSNQHSPELPGNAARGVPLHHF